MKKEYVCNDRTVVVTGTDGREVVIKEGCVIVTRDDDTFICGERAFRIREPVLREHFSRVYTTEEQDRYERIREKAMVAALPPLIATLNGRPVSTDMHELENVVSNAIWFGDRLVEKLKEKEF